MFHIGRTNCIDHKLQHLLAITQYTIRPISKQAYTSLIRNQSHPETKSHNRFLMLRLTKC